jgi:hypothetical protein
MESDFAELLPEGSLRDDRLRRRGVGILHAIMRNPGASFAKVFGESRDRIKAAYRFCENDVLDFPTLLVPTFRSVGRVAREAEERDVLCLEDTTELDLTHMKATEGLGEIGNPMCRGLFLHSALAVTPDGVPLGLLSAETWVRDPREHGKAADRRTRPFDDKESAKWWKAMEVAEHAVARKGRLVHICDRFADVFALLARCQASGYRVLVRARHDRPLADGGRLRERAASWPIQGTRALGVRQRPAPKEAEEAEGREVKNLSLRFGQVRLEHSKGAMDISVVLVREEGPAAGDDPIEWLLLTTDELRTTQDAWTRVDWYIRRWLIEEMHKCLKSGCRIEERQFKQRQHFEVALSLYLLISVRLLQMRNLSRSDPELPATAVFTQDEAAVLEARRQARGRDGQRPLSLSQAVLAVAVLGGCLSGRRSPNPGFLSLWRGYEKLDAIVEGYRLARTALSLAPRKKRSVDKDSP